MFSTIKAPFIKLLYCLLIFTILFAAIACTPTLVNKKKLQELKIATTGLDHDFTINLEKNYRHDNKAAVKSTVEEMHCMQAETALLDGSIDLFIGSMENNEMHKGIAKIAIAKDGLAIIVNHQNPLRNLSRNNLLKIFSGAVSNWKDLNASNQPIMLVKHPESSLETKTLEKELGISSMASTSSSVQVKSYQEALQSVDKFPNAISYTSFAHLNDNIKALNIDNIPATDLNIRRGYFPFSRSIYVYFNRDKLQQSKKYESFKEFTGFIHSEEGQKSFAENGRIALSHNELELARIDKRPFVIGVASQKEGRYIDLGRGLINAAKLAVEEANAKGDIDGRPLELMICDDKGTPEGAVHCADKFVENHVLGVVGHLTSQESIEASKVYSKHGIVHITPGTTHPWFTERPASRGYAFRTCGRDDQQAQLIAQTIRKLPNKKHPLKISIINNGTVYGTSLSALIEDEVSKIDLDEVVDILSINNEKQFSQGIQNFNADVLVFVGEYGDAASIVKSLALNNKSNVVFIGADGVYSKRFIEEGGLRAESAYVIGNAIQEDSIMLSDFSNKFENRFKDMANSFAVHSYDASNILISAIQSAKTKTPEAVAEEVKNTQYQGLMGVITFDEVGDPILPRIALYKITNGKFVKQ